MSAARVRARKPVTAEMADYHGYRYAVGGGSAFFLGLLTAGLYPGVAVITRLRRHRADESQLYFRMVDVLRGRFGSQKELEQIETLADRMRRKASRGVLAILAAVALSVTILATGPATVITHNTFRGHRIRVFEGSYYDAEAEVLTTGLVMAALAAAFLIAWAVLALISLHGHRQRTVALLRSFNTLARQRAAPPVRIYPAGLSAGQVSWLVLTVFFGGLAGLCLASGLLAAYPRIEGPVVIPLFTGLTAVVLPVYVWVAMVSGNHVRRWNETLLESLSASVGSLLEERTGSPPPEARPRFCRAPTCGAANRAIARYCCRCGQPL